MKTLIQTQGPETAKGDIQKAYDIFADRGLDMPDPLRLITASPGYFSIMLQRNQYYAAHPNLSFPLLAFIRYFVSCRLEYGFCRTFNKQLLIKMGVTKTDFSRLADRPGEAPLEPHEKKMLTFVLSAMEDPEAIDAGRISRLKNAGWTDADILDALAQGVGMIDHNIFMRVFTAET